MKRPNTWFDSESMRWLFRMPPAIEVQEWENEGGMIYEYIPIRPRIKFPLSDIYISAEGMEDVRNWPNENHC